MTVALVVPTVRPESLRAFLAAWEPARFWDHLVIVEDDIPAERLSDRHYGHPEIAADLGRDAWIISKRDSAIRCYGFLVARRLGADLVVTLDDDTRPVAGQDFLAGHRRNLDETPRWVSSVPGLVPRGMPYVNRGTLGRVAISMGLWAGVPDQDAAHQLVSPLTDWTPPEGSWVLPAGTFSPVCGMNLAFPTWAAPLLYFPMQGEGWPYRRFDDIWMGLLARKVCDHLGWSIVAGRPWVRHERASNPFTNIVKEAPGLAFNEGFWSIVDAVPLDADTPTDAVRQLGRGLAAHADDYVSRLGEALQIWAGLFDE